MRARALVFLVVVVSFLGSTTRLASQQPTSANPPAVVDFNRDVQPIFNTNCLACHAGSNPKAGLQLDTFENALNGGDDGKVIMPGDAKSSLLIQKITDTTGKQMPPQGPLSAQDIATITAWVSQGAKPGAPGQAQSSTAPSAIPDGPTTPVVAKALVNTYCVTCHNDKLKTGNFSLQNADLTKVGDNPELWETVVLKLRAGMMPPPDIRRPTIAQYEGLRDWLESQIDKKAVAHPNPGSIVLHRLNRTEYANALRDLLDLQVDVTTLLPPDDSARGFDNVAGSLTISPSLLEAYMTAATKISRMAVGYWKSPTEAAYIEPIDASQNEHIEGLPLGTRGGMLVRHNFPADGNYHFEVQNLGNGTFIPGQQFEILVDGERIHLFTYTGVGLSSGMSGEHDGSLEVTVPIKAGSHLVGATFLAGNYGPTLDLIKQYERKSLENNAIPQLNYYPEIGFLRIQGPFNAMRPEDSPSLRKIMVCHPTTAAAEEPCAKQIFTSLMRRAYRRPTTKLDIDLVWPSYLEGRHEGTFQDGVELGLRRILVSPEFLVRGEREPAKVTVGQTYRISDLELASRLSFFIWSSIPDDQLITLASENKLHEPAVLEAQVKRMLADPRSDSLITNFGDQLFYLRNLPSTSPDGVFYPNWDEELRQSYKRETELLFNSVIREDRSVKDLLDADYTFLNERLAKHYGIPNIYGSEFRRVHLGPEFDYRRGILGQGSFETITFQQNFRTSPVKRGVWILENILGTPPPDPPPNVPPLEDSNKDAGKILTLRDQMTIHRANEPCATCHKLMDPIGFALENFDADGTYRTMQGGQGGVPIDAAATLWDGTKVSGPVELRQHLMYYSPQFVRMITVKLMTYGLGRGVEYYDMPVIRQIVRDADKNNDKFSSLLLGVIKSAPFQMRTKVQESSGSGAVASNFGH
jgi:mono/diheme cytochrome c family protein